MWRTPPMMFNFSYRQEIYDEKKEHGIRYLKWTNMDKTWSYSECTVTVLNIKNKTHDYFLSLNY